MKNLFPLNKTTNSLKEKIRSKITKESKKCSTSLDTEELVKDGWITNDGGVSYKKNNVYGVANFTILT